MINRDNEEGLTRRLYLWVSAWLEIVDGVIGVLTIGYVRFSLSYRLCMWKSMRDAKRSKEEFERKERDD